MNVSQQTPRPFTTKEFDRLVRSGGFGDLRVELLRGMIVKMNPVHVPHARVKRLLGKALEAGLHVNGLRWLVDSECSVDVFNGFQPVPDIVVWDPAAAPADIDGPIPVNAVRLIVEVADSSLAIDQGQKLTDYARGGIAEYWVADVKGGQVHRHAGPSATAYARHELARFGETFPSLAYPGLTFDTAALA